MAASACKIGDSRQPDGSAPPVRSPGPDDREIRDPPARVRTQERRRYFAAAAS